jgi:putative ABC transport system permease protein
VTVDLRILAFALGVSVLTGLLFSLAPVFQNSRSRIGDALKDGAKGTVGSRGSYLRKTLVVVETALALMLLVGAGLLINSFVRLAKVDPGFVPQNVYAVPVRLDPSYTTAQRDPFFRELIERVARLPNVQTVSAVMNLPIGDVNWRAATFSEHVAESDDAPPVNIHMAYPNYFGAIGIRLLEGRDFTAQDRPGQPEVAIVNESLARLHWPEGDAVGQRLRIGFGEEEPSWVTVIGIVNDVHQAGLASLPISELYRSYPQAQQDWMSRMYIVVKHSGEEATLAVAVRDEVLAMDSKLPLSGLGSLESRIFDSIQKPRFYSSLLATFAVIALILAGAGIYGTLLYSVGQRSREVGIRMALGAKASDVTRLIVGQGMTLVAVGVASGLMGAYAASRFLESFLFGVTSHDVPTFAAVAVALALVGFFACYSPARRAARTDPVTTLRSE